MLQEDLIHAVTAHWDHARQMEQQVGDAVVNVTRELVREQQACLRCDQAAAVRYKIVPPEHRSRRILALSIIGCYGSSSCVRGDWA